MIRLIKREQLPLPEHWRLRAYKPGTVKLGPHREYHSPDGSRIFIGQDIIPMEAPLAVLKGQNTIMLVGRQLIGNSLIDAGAQWDTGLTYCALGSDNTAPAEGQTQLVDEGGGTAMRRPITSKTRVDEEITLSTFFTKAQSTLAIEEAAIFGSSTADGTENSGVMFARWLSSFDNSGGLFDLTFDYYLTIG